MNLTVPFQGTIELKNDFLLLFQHAV